MNKPFFSILIPVYNVEKYFRQCLDMVICQTFEDFEVIMVNDGSTDSSSQIAEEFVNKDNRFKLISQKNIGLFFTRQIAYKNSIGKYCLFLDSDDKWKNAQVLKILYDILKEKQWDIVQFEYEKFDNNGNVIKKQSSFENPQTLSPQDYFINLNKRSSLNSIWSKVFIRELFDFEKLSSYPKINMGEDLIYTANLVSNANTIYYTNEVLSQYRCNRESMSYKFYVEDISSKLMPYEELLKFSKKVLSEEYFYLAERNYCKAIAVILLYSFNNINGREDLYINMCKNMKLYIQEKNINTGKMRLPIRLPISLLLKEKYKTLLLYKKILQKRRINNALRKVFSVY